MGSLFSKHRAQVSVFLADYGFKYLKGEILDVGCGNKPFKRFAQMEGVPFTSWTGVDIRPVAEIQADMESIPVADQSYDNVLCTDTMHLHLNPLGVLRELHRIIRNDGYLVLTLPGARPENGEDLWGFRVNGIAWLLKTAGFEPVVIEGYGVSFKEEGENFLMQERTGVALTLDLFRGWLGMLDQRYPSTYGVVAIKKEEVNGQDDCE